MTVLDECAVMVAAERQRGLDVGALLVGRKAFNAICTALAYRHGSTQAVPVNAGGDGPEVCGLPVYYELFLPTNGVRPIDRGFAALCEQMRQNEPPEPNVVTG